MTATTAAANVSGNITKENVEQVARLVKADPHCPEAAAFFNFADTSVPYNQAVRKWLYTRKLSMNLLKDISMEDYFQAYSLYLFENMQTEWDSDTYDFHYYLTLTTQSHGKFCFALIRGYCDYRFVRVLTEPTASDSDSAEEQSDSNESELAVVYQALPGSTSPIKQRKSKSRADGVRIIVKPDKIHMNDIDEYSELTDATDFTKAVETRMSIDLDRLFADLRLSDINRDILIEYVNNGNSVWTNQRENYTLPYDYIRQLIFSKYGVLLNNTQIYKKISCSKQKVRSRITKKGMRIQDYS